MVLLVLNAKSLRRFARLSPYEYAWLAERRLFMTTPNEEFLKSARQTCRDIQNRFYSENIKINQVAPVEPWWLKKVSELEKNISLFLSNPDVNVEWSNEFGPASLDK
jgi:hypothetical protein